MYSVNISIQPEECTYLTILTTLNQNINKLLNLYQQGIPFIQKCRKIHQGDYRTVNAYFAMLLNVYEYIINDNEILQKKIQKKWFKHFQYYQMRETKKLTILNSLCSKRSMGLTFENVNTINNLFRYCGYKTMFGSWQQIKEFDQTFEPITDFWTSCRSNNKLKCFSNKKGKERVDAYNIDAFECVCRHIDGWVNNNNYINFNKLFGWDIIVAYVGGDKCTADGMSKLGFYGEGFTAILGDKAASANHVTIMCCCAGSIKDNTESFTQLYAQNEIRTKMNALMRRPAIVQTVVYTNNTRVVSTALMAYETKIHQKINKSTKEQVEEKLQKWDEKNPKVVIKEADLKQEKDTEFEIVTSRSNNIMGMGQLKQKRKLRKDRLKYQWYREYEIIKHTLKHIKLPLNFLPIKGIKKNKNSEQLGTTESDKIINNLCQKTITKNNGQNLPYLSEFTLSVSYIYIHTCT